MELTAFWVHAFPCRKIELPEVGCTGKNVPIELSVGEYCLLVGAISLIGTNIGAGQVDQEDELIADLDISHVTFPKVTQRCYGNPL
jgi:hypothetical protein